MNDEKKKKVLMSGGKLICLTLTKLYITFDVMQAADWVLCCLKKNYGFSTPNKWVKVLKATLILIVLVWWIINSQPFDIVYFQTSVQVEYRAAAMGFTKL